MFSFVRGVRGRAVVVVLMVAGLLGGVTAGSVTAATSTTVTWKVTSLTAGQVKGLSDVATSKSRGVKTWSKKGSCTLTPKSKPTKLTMGSTGSCTLTLKIAKSGKYPAKTSTKTITRSLTDVLGRATKAPAGPVALGLNLSGATVLVQTSQVSARSVMENRVPYFVGSSNLYKITASGSVKSVVTNKDVNFNYVVVGPTGKMYSITYGQDCLLAETDVTTNQSVCIENGGGSLTIWQSNETANFPRIQFDNSGGVYYLALTPRSDGRDPPFFHTIRRYKDGVITDMFDLPKQNIRFWHVVPNGSVIFSGQVLDYNSAGEQYEVNSETKIVTSDGRMSVISAAQAWFFSDFGTDLVYYGLCGSKINDPSSFECGHRIYDPVTEQVRDTYFLSGSMNTPLASAIYDADEICAAYPAEVIGSFCGNSSYGTIAGPFSSTTNGAYFAKIEAVMQPYPSTHLSQVFQYYPEVKPVVSSVLKARIIETKGDDLFLSGVDRSGNFITIKLNTNSGSESTMLSVADGIDVVELEAVGSENKLYFRGTRVTDNSKVVGFVDLSTNAVTIQNFTQGSAVNIEAVSQ